MGTEETALGLIGLARDTVLIKRTVARLAKRLCLGAPSADSMS